MTKHGLFRHPAYRVWIEMRRRCRDSKRSNFQYYGARGIRVCKEWGSFEIFWQDMGPTYQQGLTLDRKDTSGNYEPQNCRWSTRHVQNVTRRKWSGTKSRYRGVDQQAGRAGWRARIGTGTLNGKRKSIFLGFFNTEKAAGLAYDAAAIKYFGSNAVLNFPKV